MGILIAVLLGLVVLFAIYVIMMAIGRPISIGGKFEKGNLKSAVGFKVRRPKK